MTVVLRYRCLHYWLVLLPRLVGWLLRFVIFADDTSRYVNPICPHYLFACRIGLGPHVQGCARILNILSTVLGILWAIWIPVVIIYYTVIAVSIVSSCYYGYC